MERRYIPVSAFDDILFILNYKAQGRIPAFRTMSRRLWNLPQIERKGRRTSSPPIYRSQFTINNRKSGPSRSIMFSLAHFPNDRIRIRPSPLQWHWKPCSGFITSRLTGGRHIGFLALHIRTGSSIFLNKCLFTLLLLLGSWGLCRNNFVPWHHN